MKKATMSRQNGAALITSLVILLILTMLGVFAMGGSSLQELMVGNLRSQTVALDAAEAALREAERRIENWGGTRPQPSESTTTLAQVYVKDIFFDFATDPTDDFDKHAFDTAIWGTENDSTPASEYSSNTLLTAQPPRYVIEDIGDIAGSAGYHERIQRSGVSLYRITTRAVGLSDNSIVILQSTYGKRF